MAYSVDASGCEHIRVYQLRNKEEPMLTLERHTFEQKVEGGLKIPFYECHLTWHLDRAPSDTDMKEAELALIGLCQEGAYMPSSAYYFWKKMDWRVYFTMEGVKLEVAESLFDFFIGHLDTFIQVEHSEFSFKKHPVLTSLNDSNMTYAWMIQSYPLNSRTSGRSYS